MSTRLPLHTHVCHCLDFHTAIGFSHGNQFSLFTSFVNFLFGITWYMILLCLNIIKSVIHWASYPLASECTLCRLFPHGILLCQLLPSYKMLSHMTHNICMQLLKYQIQTWASPSAMSRSLILRSLQNSNNRSTVLMYNMAVQFQYTELYKVH